MKRIALVAAIIAAMLFSMVPAPFASAAALSSITVSPSTIAGGVNGTAILKLSAAASAGGQVVNLTSSNTNALTLPASATVPAGSTQVSVAYTAKVVTADTPVTVTAESLGVSKTATVTVKPAAINTVTANPSTIVNGNTSVATVKLTGNAPTGGAVVSLSSSNTAVATVPASMTVAAGQQTGTFTITAKSPAASTSVTITATYVGLSRTVRVTVQPLALSSVSLGTTVVAGKTLAGKVNLNGPAPTGGVSVTLSSSNTSAATVPSPITIPAGSSSGDFTLTAKNVAANTSVTITATAAGLGSKTATTTVTALSLQSLTVNSGNVTSGTSATGRVTLTGPAPAGGAVVAISSSNASAVTMPATVTVPEAQTNVTFTISANTVAAATPLTITGTLNGVSKSANLTVDPVTVLRVTLTPNSTIGGQSSVTGFVTLTGPAPAEGIIVTLSSDNPAAEPIASVTVAEGMTTASFGLTTQVVSTPVIANISATYAGTTKSASLSVGPLAVTTFILPQTAYGGNNVNWTLVLNGVAPVGGITVTLSSSNSSVVSPPVSAVIPEGEDSVEVSFVPAVVSTSTKVTLTATYGQTAKTGTIDILPAKLSNIGLNAGIVTGGLNVTGTVLLTGPAPTGGIVVSLTTDNTIAQIPATVTIPAGEREADFAFSTVATPTQQTANIDATAGGVKVTTTLTINPPALRDIIPNPISVTAGGSTTVTLRLTGPAPTGGTSVFLSSSEIATATTPNNVTVPAGQRSVQFQVTGTATAQLGKTLTLTALLNGKSIAALIQITSLQLSGFSVSPATAIGGSTVTGTLTINGLAPVNGAAIALISLDPVAIVPDAVSIVNNTSQVQFSIQTLGVTSTKTVQIFATFNSNVLTVDLTLQPLKPQGVSFEPNTIEGGQSSVGTITLNGPVPPLSGGIEVTLSSSDPATAAVPASVTIPEGATAMTFNVTALPVSTQKTVTISAVYSGTTVTGSLTINPPQISSVSVDPTSVTGGETSQGVVTLTSPAPTGGWTVNLNASNPVATVPTTVTVAAGNTTATFTISTIATPGVQLSSISASRAGSVTKSADLTVVPPVINGLSLNPTTILGGNGNVTGTIALTGIAPFGGWVVTLSSSDTSVATVPATVTIPAGQSSVNFTITTLLTNTTKVTTISATENGNTDTEDLTVLALMVDSITINRTSVVGGNTATATITLNTGAPTTGASVVLSTDSPSATSLPASLSFSSGQTTKTVTITTNAVATVVTATYTATLPSGSKSASMDIVPPTPSSLLLSPTTVVGGVANSTATITLNGKAPAGGAVVALTYSGSGATGPATVTVPADATSTTFALTTSFVTSQQTLSVTGSYNGVDRSATLTVNQHRVSSMSLSPSTVTGSITNSTATITLNAAAPAGGTVVNLSSSNTNAATVPATVTVPAGSTSTTFTITSLQVAASTSSTITATYNSSTRTQTLTVQTFGVTDITLNPTSVIGNFTNSTATVTVGAPAAAGGTVVTLTSSNTAAATVPATVTVPEGATSVTFQVTSKTVSSSTNVSISASASGATETAVLTVLSTTVQSLSLSPSTTTGGVGTATGTVTLNVAAPTGGIAVPLSSSNTSAATVPPTVTVPAGQTSANFTITTSFVSSSTNVTITATFNGSQAQTLTVTPIAVNSLSVSPSSVNGGAANATGTVTLNTAAPTGGVTVSLSSSNTNAATVPASVTIAAGQTQTTFTVTSLVVSSSTSSTITATLNGSRTASISVNPVGISSVSLDTSSLVGGSASVTGTVTLSSAAPTGGAVVTLSSNRSSASVPASVTVPAGATQANFAITTSSVAGSTTATITATRNGSATASLTLNPPVVSTVTFANASVTGVTSNTGTVTINVPAPSGGIWVTLSDNSSATGVPSGVAISAGNTSATFTITTSAVAADTVSTITATFSGSSANGSFTVLRPVLTSISIAPQSINDGNDAVGTVTLNGPAPSAGMTVSISDNSSKLDGPSSVFISAGNTTATYDMSTDEVNGNITVTVTASLNGVSRTFDVLIRD